MKSLINQGANIRVNKADNAEAQPMATFTISSSVLILNKAATVATIKVTIEGISILQLIPYLNIYRKLLSLNI